MVSGVSADDSSHRAGVISLQRTGTDVMHTFMLLGLFLVLVIVVTDEILELVFHFLEERHGGSEVAAGFSRYECIASAMVLLTGCKRCGSR